MRAARCHVAADAPVVAPPRRPGRRHRRQDEPARVRARHDERRSGVRDGPEPGGPDAIGRRLERRRRGIGRDGMAVAAVGTDTGGSIRIPAAACGIVGLEAGASARCPPTASCRSARRSITSARSRVRSPMRRRCIRCSRARQPGGLTPRAASGLRLGRLGGYIEAKLHPDVRAGYESALERIARGRRRDRATTTGARRRDRADLRQHLARGGRGLPLGDARPGARALSRHHPGAPRARPPDPCRDVPAALAAQDEIRGDVDAALTDVDALVLPGIGHTGARARHRQHHDRWRRRAGAAVDAAPHAALQSLGHPAIVLPCGRTRDGLPLSLQLVGHKAATAALLDVAAAVEAPSRRAGLTARIPHEDTPGSDDCDDAVCHRPGPVRLPRAPQERCRRRPLRPQDRRPVSLAGGPEQRRDARPGSRRKTKSPSTTWRRFPSARSIHERLTELWNYERFSPPSKEGALVHLRQERRAAEPGGRLQDASRLDARRRGADRSEHAVGRRHRGARRRRTSPTTASCMAYALAASGSDWHEWHVRDVATGKDLPDASSGRSSRGAAWLKDGSGFFYSRYDEPKAGERAHGASTSTRRSTSTSSARRRTPTRWSTSARISRTGASAPTSPTTGATCSIYQSEGTEPKNRIFVKDLPTPGATIAAVPRQVRRRATRSSATTAPRFYVQTDNDAPRGALVAIDLTAPEPAAWKTSFRRRRAATCWRGVDGSATASSHSGMTDAHERAARLRARRRARARDRAADARLGRRLQRQAQATPKAFYAFTSFTLSGDGLSLRFSGRRQRACSGSRRSPSTPADFETDAGLLPVEGRHEDPDVHHVQEGAAQGRAERRRCSTATAASTSR